jgi:ubiquitin conjugation factor E4 B
LDIADRTIATTGQSIDDISLFEGSLMVEVQSPSLDAWLYLVPLVPGAEPEIGIAFVCDLEEHPDAFDDFLESFATIVDFTRISSTTLLFRLSSVEWDMEAVSKIGKRALAAFPRLCESPAMLDEHYTERRIVYDVCDFLCFEMIDKDWLHQLVAASRDSLKAVSIFTRVVEMIIELTQSPRHEIADASVVRVGWLLSEPLICSNFVHHPNFADLIFVLFSRSSFAIDSFDYAMRFFGDRPHELTHVMIDNLNRAFDPYLRQLLSIMRNLLSGDAYAVTLTHIPTWLRRLDRISRSGFMYTTPQQMPRAEAFGLNFEAVMIMLVLRHKDDVELIDPLVPYLPGSLTPFASDQNTLAECEDDEAWSARLSAVEGEPGWLSRIFFVAAQCVEFCSCGLIRLQRSIDDRCRAFQRDLDPHLLPSPRERINNLKTNSVILLANLLREQKVTDFDRFARVVLNFLLHVGRIIPRGQAAVLVPEYAHLPEYVFEGMISVLCFYVQYRMIKELHEFLSPLASIFSKKIYLKSVNVKSKIISLFSSVAEDERTKYLVCGLPHIVELMFPSLLEFYCSLQVTDVNTTLYDRFPIRIASSNLLLAWLDLGQFREFFAQHRTEPAFSDFVSYLVNDTLYFADHTLNQLKTIAGAIRARQDGDEPGQIVAELAHARLNLSVWSSAMEKANRLITTLLSFTPVCFRPSVVCDALSKMLLCLLDLYANQAGLVSPENLQGCRFNSIGMLRSLVGIANAMMQAVATDSENQVFLERLVEYEMFPAAPIVEKIQSILDTNEMLRGDLAAHFRQFVRAVGEATRKYKADEIDFDDAPEEFIDPLTYMLMKDPLKLPSGNILDRHTLEKSLLDRPEDPFTRQRLKLEDCELQTALKQRINE